MRFVTPGGDIREINERDHPEEMQVMRSSYGLLGIVYEEITNQGAADDRVERAPPLHGAGGVPPSAFPCSRRKAMR